MLWDVSSLELKPAKLFIHHIVHSYKQWFIVTAKLIVTNCKCYRRNDPGSDNNCLHDITNMKLLVPATSMIKLCLLHSTQLHHKFKTTQEMSAFCVQKGHGQAKSRVKCTTWTLGVCSCKKESLDKYHVSCDTKGSHNKNISAFLCSLV